MNKKFILLPVLGIALTSAVALGVLSHGVFATQPERYTYTVDFFNNYLREDFELSNGTKGKGNKIL